MPTSASLKRWESPSAPQEPAAAATAVAVAATPNGKAAATANVIAAPTAADDQPQAQQLPEMQVVVVQPGQDGDEQRHMSNGDANPNPAAI